MAANPEKRIDDVEVIYGKEHWEISEQLRDKAQQLMTILEMRQIRTIVHGSVARGDVNEDSDIDVFIPNPPSSFQIETALEQANIPVNERTAIQATPLYAMKGYLTVGNSTTVSFPLMAMRTVEREFYQFSGQLDLNQLKTRMRVAGVNKNLMLIEPTESGHFESSIIGREEAVAEILGVTVETVLDRVRTLRRRGEVGRTGVFVKRELAPHETFEFALRRFAEENPAVRRRSRI